jgi:uncharacterized protein
MKFELSEKKNQSYFVKHGIWFEEAQTVWSDGGALEFFDPDHSLDEDRFVRLGHSTYRNLLLVVFCE